MSLYPTRKSSHLLTPIRHVFAYLESNREAVVRGSSTELVRFLLNLRRPDRQSCPGLLVLVGPPGGGKTWSIDCLASALGVCVLRLSLADCESALAGSPSALLRKLAKQADRLEEQGHDVVMIVEDAECGFGMPRHNQASTTNLSQLQGTLQELLDGRHCIDGRLLGPKSFIFTANSTDFKQSMLREMRAQVVEHNPSFDDRVRIARAVLSPILPRHVLSRQIRRLASLSVAEIASVKADLRRVVEDWIAADMSWPAYQDWLRSDRSPGMTDAVARRLLCGRDVKEVINNIRQRGRIRETYL